MDELKHPALFSQHIFCCCICLPLRPERFLSHLRPTLPNLISLRKATLEVFTICGPAAVPTSTEVQR